MPQTDNYLYFTLNLREERRLRVFENSVLRRIFGPKMDEVAGEWRKLHNEELNDLYCSSNMIRVKKIEKNAMGGVCSTYWDEERRVCCFGGQTWGTDHLGNPGLDGRLIRIKIDLQEVVWTGFIWLRIRTGGGHL